MFNVIKGRYVYFGISFVLILFSIFFIFFGKKNFGIDMTGGTQSEYSFEGEMNLENLQEGLENLKNKFNEENNEIINGISVYSVSGEDKIIVEAGYLNNLTESKLENIKVSFKEKVTNFLVSKNDSFVLSNYSNIGQSFGDYIKNTAFLTLAISLILITFYIAYAYFGVAVGINSFSFAIITLLTLFHDVLISTGLYIFSGFFYSGFKIDTYFVTVLLTILGYSINDTIVIFDRIRENIKKHIKTKQLDEMINISINETITRSIYTSLTLLFVVSTIFIFGPESLNGFMLVLIFGIIVGTYSSIFIAAPFLYEINRKKKLKIFKKKVVREEDKIVV